MKTILKVLGALVALLVVAVIGTIGYCTWSWGHHKFDAPYPEIVASTDSAVVARGRYLAYGPAHCATCHVPLDKVAAVESGEVMPLIGGWELTIPIGTFRAPNLTPCKETGIGRFTDAELARTLRHSVGHDGRYILELMPFQNLSDEDLTAVISFLRSQEAVKHEVKPTEFSTMGKVIFTLMGAKPVGPKQTPPKSVAVDTTVEYGSYLAHSVANCNGCHTERDLKTGVFIGRPFAGGMYFEADALSQGYSFITPNLTPDEATGIMARWDENTFYNRFRAGRVHKGSHMPWGAFSRMNEVDIRALYRYLRTVSPVNNAIDQIVFEPGQRPAGK